MKGKPIPYSEAEMAWLEANRTMVIGDYHAAFVAEFGRHDIEARHLHALRKRKGWKTGRTGCFSKGQEPHNKGKPFNPPGSEKGRFKKGNLPHNAKYLGHERVTVDGYVEVSVAETNPHTGFERRYVLKHVKLWEEKNGPIPDGYCLKCLNGNRQNTDPENWEAIPRALLPRLSGGRWHKPYDAYEPEVRPVVLNIAKLDHMARTARQDRDT